MSHLENEKKEPPAAAEGGDEIDLIGTLQIIADNLRLLTLGPLLVGIITLGVCLSMAPTFTASTKFLPPQQQQSAAASMLQSLGALGGIAGAAAGLKNPTDQYISFLKTRSVQEALVRRFDLQTRYHQKFLDSTRRILEGSTTFTSGKDNIITIQVDDKDPQVAADIANAYVEELRNLVNRLAVTEAQQRRLFFEKQLTETKNKLSEAEKTLAASGISIAALNASPSLALERPARLRAQITAQEIKIASLRTYLTDSAPEIRQSLGELSALNAQLSRAEKEQAGGKNLSSDDDYIKNYREYKYQEALFDIFTRQFEMARIDESREGATIQVVDSAIRPERKSKPKITLTTITSTIGSFFIFFVAALFRRKIAEKNSDPENSAKIKALRESIRNAFSWRRSRKK